MRAETFASALVLASLFVAPASGHHSPAAYDRQQQVTIEGVVRDYEWANPHVYIHVAVKDGAAEVVWQVEASPPSNLARQGWSRATLVDGEHVVVTGNPPANPERRILFGRSLRKDDGAELVIYGPPPASAGGETRTAVAAKDLTGVWLVAQPAPGAPRFSQAASLPLTEKGTRAVQRFSEESYPLTACMPPVAPALMMSADIKEIVSDGDTLKIRSDSWWGTERIIHLGVRSHEGVTPTLHGHSIGRWEGDVLVVDTARFADYEMGNGRELPSGAQKQLVERFAMNADRSGLTYEFVLTDPEYLAAPVMGQVPWSYQPETSFAPVECDVENARRFLEE